MARYKELSNGWILDQDNNRQFTDIHARYWNEYQEWLAVPNTPDPPYTLEEAKALCVQKAIADYETALDEPINDGTDDIDVRQKSKSKIHGAKASGKTSVKVRKSNGHMKTYTDLELDDLLDLIDDRDDALLDALDSTLDDIEAATTLEELAPYMPEEI